MADKADRTRGQAAEGAADLLRIEGGIFVHAVEKTRVPMLVTDYTAPGNPIIYANAALLNMCGYSKDEVLGQNYHFLAGPGTDAEIKKKIDLALTAKHDVIQEVLFYRKDGSEVWVSQFVTPINENDKVTHHFSSLIDITDRVLAERGLKEANETLEKRVESRTQRLEDTRRRMADEIERRHRVEEVLRATLTEAQDHVRQRDFLIKEVNHRTKNAIQIAASLLQVQSSSASEETKMALQSATQRLMRIAEVHGMLYAGDAPDSIDFASYLHRLGQELLSSLHHDRDQVDLRVDVDDARWGPEVVIPLGLIVTEAMMNAVKYAFPEGRTGCIRVDLRRSSDALVRLRIWDNGVGMTNGRRSESLGLKLIDIFARQLGGVATVDPVSPSGTAVTVTFPDPN